MPRRFVGLAALPLGIDAAGWVRLAATAIAPLLALALGRDLLLVRYLVLAAWVALTTRHLGRTWVRMIDLAVAVALTLGFGSVATPYFLFVLAVVAVTGVRAGVGWGAAAGAAVSLAQVVSLERSGRLELLSADVLVPVLALAPLVGVAAAFATRLVRGDRTGRAVLKEANQLLVALQRVAQDMPAGLDVSSVTAAALAEIRAVTSTPAAMVFEGDDDVLHVAASPAPTALTHR